MGTFLSTLIASLTSGTKLSATTHVAPDEKTPPTRTSTSPAPSAYPNENAPPAPTPTDESRAADLLALLLAAPSQTALAARLASDDAFTAQSWTEGLAVALLRALERALAASAPMGDAVRAAAERARAETVGWATEHPVLAGVLGTVVALGVLAVLVPWVLEVGLGFEVLGPRVGSWAARWQGLYGGATPKGSLFSFLQRLGMVWRRVPKGAVL